MVTPNRRDLIKGAAAFLAAAFLKTDTTNAFGGDTPETLDLTSLGWRVGDTVIVRGTSGGAFDGVYSITMIEPTDLSVKPIVWWGKDIDEEFKILLNDLDEEGEWADYDDYSVKLATVRVEGPLNFFSRPPGRTYYELVDVDSRYLHEIHLKQNMLEWRRPEGIPYPDECAWPKGTFGTKTGRVSCAGPNPSNKPSKVSLSYQKESSFGVNVPLTPVLSKDGTWKHITWPDR